MFILFVYIIIIITLKTIYNNIIYIIVIICITNYMERSIRKWILWILFYNIKFKSIYLPKY